jgi:fructoselysine-6-P-deglycase FrlB-like protein
VSYVEDEIASQPDCWRAATERAADENVAAVLPATGERVAVIGCGTSLFIAQAYASARESAGHGETDAWAASEFAGTRRYDRVLAITRSGTTTEVLQALARVSADIPTDTPTVALTADPTTAITDAADHVVVLDFADERSVVQTRFATTALALLRASIGEDLGSAIADAREAVTAALPDGVVERTQFTFLGTGWTVGLAHEAALKLREASQSWTEAYAAMEFRHGPISVIDHRSAVWIFGAAPDGLLADLARTGSLVVTSDRDPMAELIRAQRLAVAIAAHRGLDPDRPRNLTRSIILSSD